MIRSTVEARDLARHRWASILPLFGVDSRFLRDRQGPCPMCEGRTRFRYDNKDGEGTWYCNHCGPGDGFRLLMLLNNWSFNEAAKHVREHLGDVQVQTAKPRQRDEAALKARMNEAWKAAGAVTPDTAAGRYLAARLGHVPTLYDVRASSRLYCRSDGQTAHHPAMIALFRGPDGRPSGMHRTYLTPQGQKATVEAPKSSLGRLVDGGAVRLAPAGESLGIAEGIETALAASILTGVPCWAALNAGRLEVWSPPKEVEHIVVFADRDHSFVGQRVGHALAERLVRDGFNVELRHPDRVGSDWADVLAEQLAGEKAA